MAMNAEELYLLHEDLTEFFKEFTDNRHYGSDSPVLLDDAEWNTIQAALKIVHNYYMYTKFPQYKEMQHRFKDVRKT